MIEKKYGAILKSESIDLDANIEKAKRLSLRGFVEKVETGGDWDYKRNADLVDMFGSNIMEEFGNVHFGMVA